MPSVEQRVKSPQPAAGVCVLLPPSAYQRQASDLDEERIRYGAEFEQAMPHNHVAIDGSVLIFSPMWDAQASPAVNDLAYAVYVMYVPGFSEEPELHFDWPTSPHPWTAAWVGLANWDRDVWEWHQLTDAGALSLGSLDLLRVTWCTVRRRVAKPS